jgi:hypothetical protein
MLDKMRFRLRGHTLMAVAPNIGAAFDFVTSEGFDQFGMHKDVNTGEIRIGAPLPVEMREKYTWLYHRMKALEKPEPQPPKGGPKPPKGPTPPVGGTPAAGQTPVETEVLQARAA